MKPLSDLDARYERQPRPSGLRYGIIEVTTRCQCRCPGCYMVRRNVLNHNDLSLSDTVQVLDLCREYCGRELETMDILGGEPLLWPRLQSFITVLLKRGVKPWIFTNMLAVTPNLARWLHEREIHITGKLNIDPDAREQLPIQAAMLGRSEKTAAKMIRAISVFLEAGYRAPLFRLQNLIRTANIDFVSDYYRWCLEHEIGTDLEMMGSGEAIGPEYWAIAPKPEQIAKMINLIQGVRRKFGLGPGFVLMPHIFGACPFFDKGLYFAVNGTIRACSNSQTTLARISDRDPIRKAYESELICHRHSLTRQSVGQPCQSCDRWEKCRGGCRATAEGTGGSYAGYPLCPLPFLTGI